MSIYGYLNCHDCRQKLYLGKALHENYQPWAFHAGSAELPANWQRIEFNRVIWKFLADHTMHRIDVRLEHDMTDEMWKYSSIDSSGVGDISLEEYFRNWPGFELEADSPR